MAHAGNKRQRRSGPSFCQSMTLARRQFWVIRVMQDQRRMNHSLAQGAQVHHAERLTQMFGHQCLDPLDAGGIQSAHCTASLQHTRQRRRAAQRADALDLL